MAKHITFRFEVKATLPLVDDVHDPDFYTEEFATSPLFRRDMEKALYKALKRFEAECDVEMMDFTVEED